MPEPAEPRQQGMAGWARKTASACPGCSVVCGEVVRKPQQGSAFGSHGGLLQLPQWLGGAGPGLQRFLRAAVDQDKP